MSQKTGIDYYFRHYVNLFWRWKWYINLVTPLVFCLWTFLMLQYGQTIPEQFANATIQFDQGGPLNDRAADIQRSSCQALLSSRPFLENIVEKLSLQLVVEKRFRSYIFDSIAIAKNVAPGEYNFIIKKNEYKLFYSNWRRGIKSRAIVTGKLFDLNKLDFPSASLKLTADFISEPYPFSFFIESRRNAVDRVLKNIMIQFSKEDNQNTSVMFVLFKGRDYPLIAEVANAIADNFASQNSDIRRRKKWGAEQILDKQLQEAKNNLAEAEETLRQFREANPKVGATNVGGSSLTDVSNIENTVSNLNKWIEEGLALQSRCSSSTDAEHQIAAFTDAATFLSSRQSVAAPALQIEINDVAAEKSRVDAEYSPQHPAVLENRKKIGRLTANVESALAGLTEKMRSEATMTKAKLRVINDESRRLPAKEVQFLSLERKRATMAEIYSNLLTRSNANKMSETSQAGDVSVVDRAVAPLPPGKLQTMSRLLIIGFIIALFLGFGPAIAMDHFDKRARNEEDCHRFSDLPFLGEIPEKEGDSKASEKEKLDKRLVGPGFEPGIFDEMYRLLRIKILLHLQEEKIKLLVVTSLNVGDGKSLTASNLSIVMAQQKLKTLLIDGDMRKGVQHHSFVLEKKPGLSEILSSSDDLAAMPIKSMIQQTHIPNLSLLACGMPIPNPTECMNSQKFRDLSNKLTEWFDVIILDTPPLRVAADAAVLPEIFNHYIIVALAAKTNLAAVDKKINEFPGLRKKILGIALNGTPIDKNASNYSYTYYNH